MDDFRRIRVCFKIKDRYPCKDVIFRSIARAEEYIKNTDYFSIEVFDFEDNLLYKDNRNMAKEKKEEPKKLTKEDFFTIFKKLFTK